MNRLEKTTVLINPEEDEDTPPDDRLESCLICGACEVLGEGCVLHAGTAPGTEADSVQAEQDESLKYGLENIETL
jgi:hypothetical protein